MGRRRQLRLVRGASAVEHAGRNRLHTPPRRPPLLISIFRVVAAVAGADYGCVPLGFDLSLSTRMPSLD